MPKLRVPKSLLKSLPGLYETEDTPVEDKVFGLKIFGGGRYTFYAVEYSAERREFFGWVRSALGPDCDEWGYASLDELESVRTRPFGLPLEVDKWFSPTKVGECPDYQESQRENGREPKPEEKSCSL